MLNVLRTLTFSCLPSVDSPSLRYRMSLYGINLYNVRKSRAQPLDGLLLTIAKGSSGR